MVTKDLSKYINLQTLDVSFNPMSMPFCKNIGAVLTNSQILRKLDISGCKIGYQGTRYIIDGLNRNNHL
jgi:Leucine-rich repeat (LRR) protein